MPRVDAAGPDPATVDAARADVERIYRELFANLLLEPDEIEQQLAALEREPLPLIDRALRVVDLMGFRLEERAAEKPERADGWIEDAREVLAFFHVLELMRPDGTPPARLRRIEPTLEDAFALDRNPLLRLYYETTSEQAAANIAQRLAALP